LVCDRFTGYAFAGKKTDAATSSAQWRILLRSAGKQNPSATAVLAAHGHRCIRIQGRGKIRAYQRVRAGEPRIMATVNVPDENKTLTTAEEIREFLAPFGIWYEKWDVAGRIGAEATNEEILAAYAPEIERLKEACGFVTADIINVTSETPNLDAMLNKFNKEHTHDEDEVRFTVKGRGVFHIHPQGGPVFSVTVESGDLINVPAGTQHWFDLCDDRNIRCIRLFEDMSGWTPHYVEDAVHESYAPVCWGPNFIPQQETGDGDSVVNL
jgi:1,2-dihydroxy-3-keto-5-methylthiopentene dioxygenase